MARASMPGNNYNSYYIAMMSWAHGKFLLIWSYIKTLRKNVFYLSLINSFKNQGNPLHSIIIKFADYQISFLH